MPWIILASFELLLRVEHAGFVSRGTYANVSAQAPLVRIIVTTTPPPPSARNRSVLPQRAVVSLAAAAVQRQEARRSVRSAQTITTTHLVASGLVQLLVPASLVVQASLHSAPRQLQTLAVDCSAVEVRADSAPPTRQEEALAVVQPAVSAQQRPMPPTTAPQAHRSRPTPKRMAHPQHNTTRPSPSSNHT